jgi:hypothetical protein
MKKNVFGFVFIALIYLFPFRYALLEPTSSNVINLLSAVATIIGTLVFMGVMMDDGKPHAAEKVAAETHDRKQAA